MEQNNLTYEINWVNLDEILPYDKNPRKNDAAILEVYKSLKSFGWQQHLVLKEDYVLICGHTRLLAAKILRDEGDERFFAAPCKIVSNLSEVQIRAYRIMDNRTSEFAEWDKDLLTVELEEIEAAAPEYSPDYIGFSLEDIDAPAEKKEWDLGNDEEEFVATVRGPLTLQHVVTEAVKEIQGVVFEVRQQNRSF